MAEITNSDIFPPGIQDEADSIPLSDTFNNFKNRHNQLNTTVNGLSTAASGAEITAARPNHEALLDRLNDNFTNRDNHVLTGFEVIPRASGATMHVEVTAGKALVGGVTVRKGFLSWSRVTTTITVTEENHGRSNGNTIVVKVSSDTGPLALGEYTIASVTTNTYTVTGVDTGATSGTAEAATLIGPFTAPTNSQYDVVSVSSSNSISAASGNDSTDPVLPAVAITQRPLARIDLASSTTTLTNAEIEDISYQGCVANGYWFFTIQAAVDSLNDRSNSTGFGQVDIYPGKYYEEVTLTGLSDITLNYKNGARHFRTSNTTQCIKSVNTVSNEENRIKVINGDFRGNSKAGTLELIDLAFTDNVNIEGCFFDGNASSTATNKNLDISDCDFVNVLNCHFAGSDSEVGFTNSSNVHIYDSTELTVEKLNVNTTIQSTQGYIPTYFTTGGITSGALFTALDPLVPNTGDRRAATGFVLESGGGLKSGACSYIERLNATTVRIFRWSGKIDSVEAVAADFVDAISGSGLTHTVSFAVI